MQHKLGRIRVDAKDILAVDDEVIFHAFVLFLDNLLNVYNFLIHNVYYQNRMTKETNWKQKFKKIPNCKQEITKINVESNGNAKVNIII